MLVKFLYLNLCFLLLFFNLLFLTLLIVQIQLFDLFYLQLVLLFRLLHMQTVMDFHICYQLLTTVYLFLVNHSALLIAFSEGRRLVDIVQFFGLQLLEAIVFSNFFFDDRNGTQYKFVECFFLLRVQLSEFFNFRPQQREGILNILNIAKLGAFDHDCLCLEEYNSNYSFGNIEKLSYQTMELLRTSICHKEYSQRIFIVSLGTQVNPVSQTYFLLKVVNNLIIIVDMSQHFLPEIDIRIGPRRSEINSIHSLAHLTKKHKMKNNKYELIKQSILSPIATPLHQLVRVSLSNKTVVFKKRLLTEESYQKERENQAPVHYHQTNKVVIMKSSPRFLNQQTGSQLRACKSLLNAKVRERRVSIDINQKLPLNDRNRQDNSEIRVSDSLNQVKRGCSPQRNAVEEFQLCPWEDEEQGFVSYKQNQIKKQRYSDQIKRFF